MTKARSNPKHQIVQSQRRLLNNPAYLIMDVGRLLRREFDLKMARLGLSRPEWYLISHLVFFDGAAQQDLADVLDMTKGGMAKLVDRLEEKGFVVREIDTLNGHTAKRILLTQRGRTLAATVDDASTKTVGEALHPLSAAQRGSLNELLHAVRTELMNRS